MDRLLAFEPWEQIGFEGNTHITCDGEEAVSFLKRRPFRGFVKQHKGYINVESQLRAGSNFEVFLPYVMQTPAAADLPQPMEVEEAKAGATVSRRKWLPRA